MTARRRRDLSEVLAQTAPEPAAESAAGSESESSPPPVDTSPRKFTMLVAPADDERAHRVVDDVVRRAGIRATKSMRADVVRALFLLADQDDELRGQLAGVLRRGGTA